MNTIEADVWHGNFTEFPEFKDRTIMLKYPDRDICTMQMLQFTAEYQYPDQV